MGDAFRHFQVGKLLPVGGIVALRELIFYKAVESGRRADFRQGSSSDPLALVILPVSQRRHLFGWKIRRGVEPAQVAVSAFDLR
ncbi:hypothetical protein D9M69_704770 [compost metagenome]